jgi:peptide/nickel transport system substrate-binding protein
LQLRDERHYWDRVRLSRRSMVKGAGVTGVGLTTAALVGCGGGDDNNGGGDGGVATVAPTQPLPTQDTTLKAKRGGTLTRVMGGEPRTLDVHWDTFPYNTAITNNTNNGLLKWAPDYSKIETDMATTLPEQPDDVTYILKIPQGIKFQNVEPVNGREFTSADIKYSIERQMTDKAGVFNHAFYFLGRLASIETPDKYTVRFKMNGPYAPMLSYLASPWTMMICREAVEKWGDLAEHAIGTGPFILKEWQKNVKFEMERNPDYFKKELPYLDKVTTLISLDANTRTTLFIDKKVDTAREDFSQLSQLKNGRKDATYRAIPSQFWRQFRMPPTLGPDAAKGTPARLYPKPYDDVRVREAMIRAINAQEVLDLVYSGDGVLTNGPILPIYPLWHYKTPSQNFDLKKATELMAAAGYANGFSDTMVWASAGSAQNDQVGEVIKEQLKKIKVDVKLEPMELTAYYNKIYSWDYTLAHHVPLNNPDPDENLSAYFGRKSTFYKFYDEGIWAKIDKQATIVNQKERELAVQDVQKDILEKHPVKFMYTQNAHIFVDPAIKGWFPPTDGYDGRVENAWRV